MTLSLIAISICSALYAGSITGKNNNLRWTWWLVCFVFPPAVLCLIEKNKTGESKVLTTIAISVVLVLFSFTLPSLLKGSSMSERYSNIVLDHTATALKIIGTPVIRTATTFEANAITFEFVAQQSIFVYPAFLGVMAFGTSILCAHGKWIKPIIFLVCFFLVGHSLIVASLTTGIYQVDTIDKMRSVPFRGIAETFKATGIAVLALATIGHAALRQTKNAQNKTVLTTPDAARPTS